MPGEGSAPDGAETVWDEAAAVHRVQPGELPPHPAEVVHVVGALGIVGPEIHTAKSDIMTL